MKRTPQRHRRNNIGEIKTSSITFDSRLMDRLSEIVAREKDKNMSRYIEEHVSKHLPYKKEIPKVRPYKQVVIQKKTFTFSKDFAEKIQSSGNVSLFLETVLIDKLRLNLK